MIRGINQQNIFSVDEDYEKFIAILAKYHKKSEYEIYAYCLMGNHVHLLIKEGREALPHAMKRIGTSYVSWYNWQYNRKGHLFQDRYKSEPVEDDVYFLTVLRYIHQNPQSQAKFHSKSRTFFHSRKTKKLNSISSFLLDF